jgi:NAD(P)-dependent dehydrogenase (short-subunit alcohol dehydrogenase family)
VLPIAELAEQAVLITGGGRGLGRAIAVRLAQHGAAVGLVDIDAATCTETAELIRRAGGRASAYTADVSKQAALLEAAGRFAADHHGLDAVINNAMLLRYEPLGRLRKPSPIRCWEWASRGRSGGARRYSPT